MRLLSTMLALALLAAVGAGCGPFRGPRLSAGPFGNNDRRLVERALVVSTLHGYHPTEVDRDAGTFSVESLADRRNQTRFAVRCLRDGWVSVVPEGPELFFVDGWVELHRSVRDEYLRYVSQLQTEIGLSP